jgi:hypothetical protein
MDALNDIEVLVGRVIRTLVTISRKVTRFATWLLAGAAGVCVVSFLLGVAALDGGIRVVWVVLGIVFGSVAIGAAGIARWGVGRIRRDVPAIAGEVRAMVTEGREQSGLIIREFDHQMHDGEDETIAGSAIVVSRRVYGLRGLAGHGFEGATRFTAALRSITRLPLLALLTVSITIVFAFLALIFLLALALS